MPNYFDKNGNVYRIEDARKLKKKNFIEVFDEAGEEFHLAAEGADEFKLTPDETTEVAKELLAKLEELVRAIGTAGCPNIDPPDYGSIWGTRVNPAVINLARILGGGCPNIDPPDYGSIWGTRVNPAVVNLARILGGGCPNIDPADPGTIWGTRVNPAVIGALKLLGGCPNIDPPDYGSIWGTRVNPAVVNLLKVLGGGCPAIDPAPWGPLIGTLGALRGR